MQQQLPLQFYLLGMKTGAGEPDMKAASLASLSMHSSHAKQQAKKELAKAAGSHATCIQRVSDLTSIHQGPKALHRKPESRRTVPEAAVLRGS